MICITKCEKKCDHCLGGHGPLWPPWICYCRRALAHFQRIKTNFPIIFLLYPKPGFRSITSWKCLEIAVKDFEYIFSEPIQTFLFFSLVSHPSLKRGYGVITWFTSPGKMCDSFIAVGVSVNYQRTKTHFLIPSHQTWGPGVYYPRKSLRILHCCRSFRKIFENENKLLP